MRDTLTTGIGNEGTHTVTEDMSPRHLPVKVLSTPSMVQLIEETSHHAAAPHLEEHEVTVGTHICVSHVGVAMAGEDVTVASTIETIDKRRLTFRVSVRGANGVISEGTHERAVMDARRFGSG